MEPRVVVDWSETYSRAQAAARLHVEIPTLAVLCAEGLIPYKTGARKAYLFPAGYVDSLAAFLGASRLPDVVNLAQLFWLQQAFLAVPSDVSHRKQVAYRAMIRERCQQLVAEGKIIEIHDIFNDVAAVATKSAVQDWASTGRLATARFGHERYLGLRYWRYVCMRLNNWPLIVVAAHQLGITTDALLKQVRKRRVRFFEGPDRLTRIDPAEIARKLASRDVPNTVSYLEADAMLGVPEGTLNSRVGNGYVLGGNGRVPLSEVERLRKKFTTLCPGFDWLAKLIALSGGEPLTLNASQVQRQLGISAASLSVYSQSNLLPFYDRCFSDMKGERHYVTWYIDGLKCRYPGQKITRVELLAYKEDCSAAKFIV